MQNKHNSASTPAMLRQSLAEQTATSSLQANGGVTMDPNNSTLRMTFSTSNFKNGDIYTITIPKGDYWAGDGAVVAAGGDGYTTKVQKQADGSYVVTDKFTTSGTAVGIAQVITINMNPAYHINEYGNIAKKIIVQKNGKDDTSLTIFANITPKISIDSVTRDIPAAQSHAQVYANQEVVYELPVSNSYGTSANKDQLTNASFGTFDLTLNVPAHFQADIAAMKDYFTQAGLPCGNITQSAAGAPIVFTGITTGENAHGRQYGAVEIIGKYVMAAPSADTPVNASQSQGTFHFNSGKDQTITVPAWSDTILGNENPVPQGSDLSGAVSGAYSEGSDLYNTLPLNGFVGTINTMIVKNVSGRNLNNVRFRANFSRGYAVSTAHLNLDHTIGVPAQPTIKVTYYDGTEETLSAVHSQDEVYYTLNSNKQLESIEWSGNPTAEELYTLTIDGKPAAGLTTSNKLEAAINVVVNNEKPAQLDSNTQTLIGETSKQYYLDRQDDQNSFYRQKYSKDIDDDFDGYLSFSEDLTDSHGYKLVNPRFYLVVPNTVDPFSVMNGLKNSIETHNNSVNYGKLNGKVKLYKRNGKYVVEYDGEGTVLYEYPLNLSANYQLKVGMPSMTDNSQWFVSADNFEMHKHSWKPASADQMTMLDGAVSGHTFASGLYPVKIINSTKQQSGELAQGNQDSEAIQQGTSDDKQSANMTYVRYIMSDPDNTVPQMTNIVAVTNLPQANGTSFGFQLNQNGVEVIDSVTGEPVSGVTILYSTQLGNSNAQKTNLASYQPASAVTDWRQIKSVVVKVPSLRKDAIQIRFHGIDPTLADDANKTGVLTGQTWCDEIPNPMYNGLDADSKDSTSSIKVEGQSTIHIKFRYRDNNNNVQIIDPSQYSLSSYGSQPQPISASVTLKDNQDHLNADNLKNKAETAFGQLRNADTDIPVSLNSYQLADDMETTPTNTPQLTSNSTHGAYANGALNNQLTVDDVNNGDLVKYWMDGDTVIYDLVSQNSGKAQVKFVDDDDPSSTHMPAAVTAMGNTGNAISFDALQNDINSLTSKGYVLNKVTNDKDNSSLAGNDPDWDTVFGDYDTTPDTSTISQKFTIHLGHHKTEKTTTKTFQEIVHYKYNNADGTHTNNPVQPDKKPDKDVIFTKTSYHDDVTNTDTPGTWDATSKTFDSVTSPNLPGYTADHTSIADVSVTPTDDPSKPIEKTVYYTPDAQKAKVTYIDDTTGKQLSVKDLNGKSNEHSGYTTKTTITDYENDGYVLVSDDTDGNEIVFDTDDNKDQNYVVHLNHGTTTVTPEKPGQPGQPINPKDPKSPTYPTGTDTKGLTHKVNRTIEYVNADGTPVTNGIKPHHDSLTFEETKVIDKVTGAVTSDTWSKDQDFGDIPSPSETGYTPNRTAVSNKGIGHDHKDITEKVIYSPDAQKASVTYIDDTTHQTLSQKKLTGKSNENSGYTTGSTITDYKNKGYDFVSDNTNGKEIVFDTDDQTDQNYVVHLKHGTTTVTPEKPGQPGQPINPQDPKGPKYPQDTDKEGLTHKVNRTINYVNGDDTPVTNGIKPHHDSLTFEDTKVIDKVTGAVTSDTWSKDQDFNDVPSPVETGYTPDRTTVSNKGIAHDHADITETVTYNPDVQKATVKFVDDTTGKQLSVKDLNGKSNEHSGYTTGSTITDYENDGYVLVSDDTDGKEIVFDTDDQTDQNYVVHLKHGTTTVTPEKPGQPGQPINPKDPKGPTYPTGTDTKGLTHKVNRTIKYGNTDGTPVTNGIKPHHDSLTFEETKVIDKVTGAVTSDTWSKDQDFDEIPSPVETGYTPDRTTVSNKGIGHDHADITEKVTYSPDAQKASVTYIDDTTGKQLSVKNLNGKSNGHSGYTTKGTITDYENQGYDFVSDNTNGKEIVFDTDDQTDQNYVVHLKHGTTTITPEKPGQPGQPINPKDPKSPTYPTGTDTKGLTHKVNRTIKYVNADGTPVTNGIKPHHDSLTFEETKVIDKVTGAVTSDTWSKDQDFNDVPSPVETGYTPDRTTVSNKGIAHDHADITETVTYSPDTQKATVKYIDDTTGKQLSVKDLNGKSNEHSGYTTKTTITDYENDGYVLVSDDTDGNEIVFDTDDNKDQNYVVHLKHGTEPVTDTKTVTRTIHYVYSDGTPAKPDTVQTVTFKRTGTKDSVTKRTDWNTWTPSTQTLVSVVPSVIPGYKCNTPVVPSTSVTADTTDTVVIVKYIKLPTPGKPGTTPTPGQPDKPGTTPTPG